jgi:hypothetical protein
MANSTASIFIKPTISFNRDDTFVFGSWVCTADSVGSFQRCLAMTPNSKTGLVTLPEVITGTLAEKFSEILLYNHMPTSSSDLPPTRTRHPHGPSHASRLLSHHVNMPRFTSTSHMASEMLAGPTRKLSLHTGLARRSSPTTLRPPTPPPATTRIPPTSSTSGRTLLSPEPRSSRLSNRCQGQPPVWL